MPFSLFPSFVAAQDGGIHTVHFTHSNSEPFCALSCAVACQRFECVKMLHHCHLTEIPSLADPYACILLPLSSLSKQY